MFVVPVKEKLFLAELDYRCLLRGGLCIYRGGRGVDGVGGGPWGGLGVAHGVAKI